MISQMRALTSSNSRKTDDPVGFPRHGGSSSIVWKLLQLTLLEQLKIKVKKCAGCARAMSWVFWVVSKKKKNLLWKYCMAISLLDVGITSHT